MSARAVRFAALLALTASCSKATPPKAAADATPASADTRSFTILHINDTYRIEGITAAEEGGLARVRSLRVELEAEGPVLLTHGGDFLNPSFLSRTYEGAQMVDVLNRLDGDAEADDPHMFVTFGNHEFDDDDMDDIGLLQSLFDDSQFMWLDNGIQWKENGVGEPVFASSQLDHTALVELGGVKVGIYSLTLSKVQPAYVTAFSDPVVAAQEAIADLREGGAEVVVGLTHQSMEEDIAVLEALGKKGPDLVLGGHEHNAQAVRVQGRWLAKADADAVSAYVARISVDPAGLVTVNLEDPARRLDATVLEDKEVKATVDGWLTRHETRYCEKYFEGAPDCLATPLGTTNTLFEAEELSIRRFETGIGSWVADLALESFAAEGAQVAFINSGSLRLNQNLPAGTVVTQGILEELLPYPTELKLIELRGDVLQQVLDHAVEDWTGSGHWLQVAGMVWRHDPKKGRATDLHILTPEGPKAVKTGDIIKAVVSDYLMNTKYDQDGYTMLTADMVKATGPALKDTISQALQAAGEAGISPEIQGRICIDGFERPETCLLDK